MDDDDLARQIQSLYKRGNFLAKNVRHCLNEVKVTLVKSFCSNISSSSLFHIHIIYSTEIHEYISSNNNISTTLSHNQSAQHSIFTSNNTLFCTKSINYELYFHVIKYTCMWIITVDVFHI